jgi:hypothetical protein
MANAKEGESRAADIIKNWLRTRYAIEFLGVWEQINNPNFKVVESDHFKMRAGLPNFVLSASEWIEKTNAIGITVKKGKYGGTYAHKDIAFEFGSAISVAFKMYLITEFQRLKEEEQKQLGWSAKHNFQIIKRIEGRISRPKRFLRTKYGKNVGLPQKYPMGNLAMTCGKIRASCLKTTFGLRHAAVQSG